MWRLCPDEFEARMPGLIAGRAEKIAQREAHLRRAALREDMSCRRVFMLLLLGVLILSSGAHAFPLTGIETDEIVVCVAQQTETPPLSFDGPDCERTSPWEVDPQGRAIWLRAPVYVPEDVDISAGPVGLFVSIKASSRAWMNGEALGANGRPSLVVQDEIPGQLDQVYFVPGGTLKQGWNEVVLLLSGHHSLIRLSHPLHQAYLGPYDPARMRILDHYWPSLMSFGVFVLGALFFGTMALLGEDRRGSGILAVTSLAACGQLMAEITRGVWSYPYPVHDIRLLLILGFALLFGASILAWSMSRFSIGRLSMIVVGVTALITLCFVIFAPGFDGKTAAAIFFPGLGTVVLGAMAGLRGQREG
ncbi:MAG: hypothetical protein AAGA69_06385, partial [Pseudomonadota bacterium]